MKPPRGIGPARGALRAEGVRRVAVEDANGWIEVGIARQGLPLAVDEQLVGGEARRHLRLHDAVPEGLPSQRQLGAAADDGLFARPRLPIHRRVGGTGIFRREHQSLREIVRPSAQPDRHRAICSGLAHGRLSPGQSGEGFAWVPGFASSPAGLTKSVFACRAWTAKAIRKPRSRIFLIVLCESMKHGCGERG